MKIVGVIPLKKGPLKGDLSYFTSKNIQNGSIVTVTIRNKKALGLVVSSEDVSGSKMSIKDMDFNLKKILEVKEKSVFSIEYLESALLAGKYFASGKSEAITSLIPAVFREEYDKIAEVKSGVQKESREKKHIQSEKMLLQESLENRISTYKTLIRENFARHRSVFLVLPTESDIRTFEAELTKGIEQFTFSFHGGQSAKKTLEKFTQIVSIEHPVLILGTAPFLSVPRFDLGAIIVEHESSSSYKMIGRPHFDLRIFAEIFASKMNATFILSDTILRFETIARVDLDRFAPIYPLVFRVPFKGTIEIEAPKARKDTSFRILSEKSAQEIQSAVAKNKNVFIFALRKGLATETVCRDCGGTVNCEKCLAPLVLYNSPQERKEKERIFVCNRCGEQKAGEANCANCHSWNLMPLGIGTDTVIEEIKKLFPKARVLKLDKESARTGKGAEKIMREFEENHGSILVGTEMALFYLKEKVSLSVIASFETLWSIPNFKTGEKIIQLAVSIIGHTEEKFVIQAKNTKDPALLSILSRNLLSFARAELEDRKNLGYPPFVRFIKIKHAGNKADTLKAKQMLEEVFKDYSPLIFSGFITKERGKYITNALIKTDPEKWSLHELSLGSAIDQKLLAKLLTLPLSFEVFVDPEDLL